ncbi:hypothetical protein BX600DRAFT_250576 [Xylariales sp. PMI_506]|nr:hypothetical protein BX600DRAFT_250576 [Xylariales sp. PMI_506]
MPPGFFPEPMSDVHDESDTDTDTVTTESLSPSPNPEIKPDPETELELEQESESEILQSNSGAYSENTHEVRTEATFTLAPAPPPSNRTKTPVVTRHRMGKQLYCTYVNCSRSTKGFGRFDSIQRHMLINHGEVVERKDVEAEDRHSADGRTTGGAAAAPASTAPRLRRFYVSLSTRVQKENLARLKNDKLASAAGRSSTKRQPGSRVGHLSKSEQGAKGVPAAATVLEHTLQPPEHDNIESLDRDELLRRLREKTRECEEIRHQLRIVAMERDEYIEALKISEEMRLQADAGSQ